MSRRAHCECYGLAYYKDGSECELCAARDVFRICECCEKEYPSLEAARADLVRNADGGFDCNECALDAIEMVRQATVQRLTERKAS